MKHSSASGVVLLRGSGRVLKVPSSLRDDEIRLGRCLFGVVVSPIIVGSEDNEVDLKMGFRGLDEDFTVELAFKD